MIFYFFFKFGSGHQSWGGPENFTRLVRDLTKTQIFFKRGARNFFANSPYKDCLDPSLEKFCIRSWFSVFDKDRSGFVSSSEIKVKVKWFFLHLPFLQSFATGWPVIHGRVFLIPWKTWLVMCTLLYSSVN